MDKPAFSAVIYGVIILFCSRRTLLVNKKTLEERLEFRIKKLCKTINKYHKDGSVLIFAQTTTYVDALYNILKEKNIRMR